MKTLSERFICCFLTVAIGWTLQFSWWAIGFSVPMILCMYHFKTFGLQVPQTDAEVADEKRALVPWIIIFLAVYCGVFFRVQMNMEIPQWLLIAAEIFYSPSVCAIIFWLVKSPLRIWRAYVAHRELRERTQSERKHAELHAELQSLETEREAAEARIEEIDGRLEEVRNEIADIVCECHFCGVEGFKADSDELPEGWTEVTIPDRLNHALVKAVICPDGHLNDIEKTFDTMGGQGKSDHVE